MPKYKNNFGIKIGGTNASMEFYDALKEVIVDLSIGMPSMFSIRLNDPNLTWVDDTQLAIGKEIEITAFPDEAAGAAEGVLFKGEITAIEPHFSAMTKAELTIRGYDKGHRLQRGRKTRTFLKMKDSDLVSQVAQEAGLTASVDATTVVHDFVIQYNQTNMEFLQSRAERIGYQVFVADGKLYFKKGSSSLGDGPTLTYMDNLFEFEPRWTTHHQADTIKVQGWDSKKKTVITQTATPNSALNQGGMATTGGALAKTAFSAAEEVIANRPVFITGEAAAMATGLSEEISYEFIQADGECEGHPGIKPGYKVSVKNIGTRFSGKYFVTSATHIKNADGYTTRFNISGREPNTLSTLLSPGADHAVESSGVSGVVTGLVTNLKDPEELGRVKVKYAWLGEIESDWVRISTPMAGAQRGLEILPEVNDEVLIGFEHGDIHHPYILGVLWSSVDKPPVTNSTAAPNGKVEQRMFKTRKGHTVLFDDKDSAEKISIKSKSGHELTMNDASGSESITIKDKGGNTIELKSTNNSLTVNVKGDFSVTATGKITLKSTQDMSLESTANAKLKGMQLGLEGVAKGELKAPMVSVNGSAQTEVKGGAMVQVQGGLVKIN